MKRCKHCDIKLDESVYHQGKQCKTCRNGIQRYGLSRLDQLNLLKQQNGKCKLCQCKVELFVRDNQAGVIDHCHKTGKVRGVLCGGCNTLIGKIDAVITTLDLNEYIKNVKLYLD